AGVRELVVEGVAHLAAGHETEVVERPAFHAVQPESGDLLQVRVGHLPGVLHQHEHRRGLLVSQSICHSVPSGCLVTGTLRSQWTLSSTATVRGGAATASDASRGRTAKRRSAAASRIRASSPATTASRRATVISSTSCHHAGPRYAFLASCNTFATSVSAG